MGREKNIFILVIMQEEKICRSLRTQDEVVLRNFPIPNLLRQSVFTVIHISEKSKGAEAVSDFRRVVFLLSDGDKDQHSPPPKKNKIK